VAQDLIPAVIENTLDLKGQLFFHDPPAFPQAYVLPQRVGAYGDQPQQNQKQYRVQNKRFRSHDAY